MFADADEFAGESAGLGRGLFGLGWIFLAPFGRLEYVLLSFLLELFELGHVSVEFAGVCADQGVTFAHLFSPPPLDLI